LMRYGGRSLGSHAVDTSEATIAHALHVVLPSVYIRDYTRPEFR
jgi:hypothetical protein